MLCKWSLSTISLLTEGPFIGIIGALQRTITSTHHISATPPAPFRPGPLVREPIYPLETWRVVSCNQQCWMWQDLTGKAGPAQTANTMSLWSICMGTYGDAAVKCVSGASETGWNSEQWNWLDDLDEWITIQISVSVQSWSHLRNRKKKSLGYFETKSLQILFFFFHLSIFYFYFTLDCESKSSNRNSQQINANKLWFWKTVPQSCTLNSMLPQASSFASAMASEEKQFCYFNWANFPTVGSIKGFFFKLPTAHFWASKKHTGNWLKNISKDFLKMYLKVQFSKAALHNCY